MSLGLGIFLSSLMLSTVLLYRFTYERWNWRKIWRRIGFSCLGIVALVALVGIGAWSLSWVSERPRPMTSFADVSLGMSKAEVRYIKGSPPTVFEADTDGKGNPILAVKDLKDGQSTDDFSMWAFHGQDFLKRRVDVHFDPQTGFVERIACVSESTYDCHYLFNLNVGSTEAAVLAKLGNPATSSISGVVKRMEYPALNAFFYLEKQKVYMLGIASNLSSTAPQ